MADKVRRHPITPPPSLRLPTTMQYPLLIASVNKVPPIHTLPVELLARIFNLGVESERAPPEDREHTALTFEVFISHVCRHWREVALHTPHLWTTVHFRTRLHMSRGKVYLSRNGRLPIDIHVDTCSQHAYPDRTDLLFHDELHPVFDIVLPHIKRWRELHLRLADIECKISALRILRTCSSAPVLSTLQLWHVQNLFTPDDLQAVIDTPIVFAGELPALKHIILQGVNLDWGSSPFLHNLTSIEYAIHADRVRMPFNLWRQMLKSSPGLERLFLHYSGPRARTFGGATSDDIEWGADVGHGHRYPATGPVVLPHLQEIKLIDLETDYLVAVFKSIHAPNVLHLHLELETEGQDYSRFVEFLTKGGSRSLLAAPRYAGLHTNGGGQGDTVEDEGAGEADYSTAHLWHTRDHITGPRFPRLESLSVSRLVCSAESWRALLESARTLMRLEVESQEDLLGALFGTVRAQCHTPPVVQSVGGGSEVVCSNTRARSLASVRGSDEDGEGVELEPKRNQGKGRTDFDIGHDQEQEEGGEQEEMPILPSLKQIRCSRMSGSDMTRLANFRRNFHPSSAFASAVEGAFRIRRWEADESFRDDDGMAFERELDTISAQAVREARGGPAREPWRCDEPLEKVVWFSGEGDYDEVEDSSSSSSGFV